MMTRKQKPWSEESSKLSDFINENDIKFKQFSEYHFRLMNKIDVWPGSKKYWIIGTVGSKDYKNINELKQYLSYGVTIKTSNGES